MRRVEDIVEDMWNGWDGRGSIDVSDLTKILSAEDEKILAGLVERAAERWAEWS